MIRTAFASWTGLVLALTGPTPVPAQPTAAIREALRIPGEGNRYILNRAGGGVITPSGSIVIASLDDGQLLVFDAAGRYVRSVGRRGKGPGEFTSPSRIGLIGDSIWVGDPANARITLVAPTGTIGRMITVQTNRHPILLPDGSFTTQRMGFVGPNAARYQAMVLVRYREVRDPRDTILARPMPYRWLEVPLGEGRLFVGFQPFDDGPLLGTAPDGSLFVTVDRVAGRDRSFVVTAIRPGGDTVFTQTIRYEPKSLRDEHWQREVRQRMQPGWGADIEAKVRAGLFRPSHLPTVTNVTVGADHTVWLRREDDGGAAVRWTVLDPSGAVRWQAELPRALQGLFARHDSLLGLLADSLNGPSIVVYTIAAGR